MRSNDALFWFAESSLMWLINASNSLICYSLCLLSRITYFGLALTSILNFSNSSNNFSYLCLLSLNYYSTFLYYPEVGSRARSKLFNLEISLFLSFYKMELSIVTLRISISRFAYRSLSTLNWSSSALFYWT